jgi:WD40 repeat protein
MRIWHRDMSDATKWSLTKTLPADPGEVLGLAVSDDDRTVASAHRGAQLRFWSLADEAPLASRILPNTPWTPCVFASERSPGAGRMGSVRRTARDERRFTPHANDHAQRRLRAAPGDISRPHAACYRRGVQQRRSIDRHRVGDGLVKLWDAAAGNATIASAEDAREQNCLATLDGHGGRAFQVAFLPDPLGDLIAVGYQDGNVRVWDLSFFDRYIAGQVEFQIRQHQAELGDRMETHTLRAWAAAHTR